LEVVDPYATVAEGEASMLFRDSEVWPTLTSGLLWCIAGTLLYVDLVLLSRLVDPLAAGLLADPPAAAQGLARAGARILIPSFLAYTLLVLLPAWIWKRYELRQAAPLMPMLTIAFTGGETGIRLFVAYVLLPAAVVAALAYVCDRSSAPIQRWFYWTLPANASVVAAVGILYYWVCWSVLREPAGKHPEAALGLFAIACLGAALPAIIRVKNVAARVLVAAAVIWFVSAHALGENFPIHPPERILGDSASKPNVFLIVVDTLRADSLSYRAAAAPATPAIDQLASESVIFANAISPSSWTFPAMTSMMTGLAPLSSLDLAEGVLNYSTIQRQTLAELLSDHGYQTRAIVGNYLLYRPFRLTAGFQRIGTFANYAFGAPDVVFQMYGDDGMSKGADLPTREVTDQAIEYVQGLKADSEAFLWLHYFDPHGPYLPPAKFVEEKGNESVSEIALQQRLYRGEIRYVDSEIGRLVQALKEQGLFEDSVIILVSDHGEGFLEHGETGHGYDLFQELLHVPLLIHAPHVAPKTVEDYVPTNALMPTLIDLLGLEDPKQEGWPQSLATLIHTDGADYEGAVISGANYKREPQWSVVAHGMKYIYREETKREDVYDLQNDPGEQHSLANPPEDFLQEARAALDRHLKFAARTREEAGLSGNEQEQEELLERMKSLGYIQ
jgi:arylsulfatase A-like enzyme